MAMPKLIEESHIKQLEDDRHEAFHKMMDQQEAASLDGNPRKQEWLAVYARCLSPSLACKQTGVPISTYQAWRKKDPDLCRGINLAISQAHDELRGAVIVRATGYLQNDPQTGEIERDATGKPIYRGGSDVLAKKLLEIDTDTGKSTSPVSITINTGAFWQDDAAVVVEQGGEVLEHDDS